jgi:hypothetical protein
MAILVLSALIELALHLPGFWRLRRELAMLAAILSVVVAAGLVWWNLQAFALVFALLSLYRLFNMARIWRAQLNPEQLQKVTFTTSLVLIILQLSVLLAWLGWDWAGWTAQTGWLIIAGLQAAAAFIYVLSVIRNLKHTRWPGKTGDFSDDELPALTIAVPARNETDDLHDCLAAILSTNYPKLEVLVYDDCSQTKRTPEIIRSFAHAGVRFLQGEQPDEKWLAKNKAYDQLAREASGQYILFCGVDVRFGADSFRQLIGLMLTRHKQMLSVVPQRSQQATAGFSPIQAMRYWWEFAPPRRLFNRPPVLSSCWLIERRALQAAGGFPAVRRKITPEAYFASYAARNNDGYSFLRAGDKQELHTVKTAKQQRETAVRVRYPQLHRRPEQAALHSMLEMTLLVLPFVVVISGFWIENISVLAQILALVACVCIITAHELIALTTKVNSWVSGLLTAPIAALTDIYLLNYSMFKYEFSEVLWKGRNVCVPVMHRTKSN